MSQGFQSQLGIDTVSPVTRGYEFENCQITKAGTIIDSSGIRGGRSHHSERTRQGNDSIAGVIELYPSPADLSHLLPLVLGGTPSGTTYPLADGLAAFYVTVDKVAGVYTYAGCKVDKATFSGVQGQAMKLSLEIAGQTETPAAAGSFPAVTLDNSAPLVFSDSTLTLLGISREVKQWTVTIDNSLEVRFANSTSATAIMPKDRQVSLQCQNPFTSAEIDLYGQALAGSSAALVLAGAGSSLAFNFATLQFPDRGPVVPGREEITLTLSGIARKVGSTDELSVVLTLGS
ncbi:MAG TPA: phage tail tube protein [Pirellulales bacterium]